MLRAATPIKDPLGASKLDLINIKSDIPFLAWILNDYRELMLVLIDFVYVLLLSLQGLQLLTLKIKNIALGTPRQFSQLMDLVT